MLKTRQQLRLGKQENMWPPLGIAACQAQQTGQRGVTEILGIINQHIDFLPSQRQLPDLSQNRRQLWALHLQALSNLTQNARRIRSALRRNHNTLHSLLVSARN